MENERKKKLIETLKSFNKKEKEEVLFFGNEIENQELISTGIKSIDKFLAVHLKNYFIENLWKAGFLNIIW